MVDTVYSNVKGGGVRTVAYSADCALDCSACSAFLPDSPRKVNTHEHPSYQPNWITYDPSNSLLDKECVAADEIIIGQALFPNVPVGYTLHRLVVPAYSILKGLGVTHTLYEDPYGLADNTMDGFVYTIQANKIDTCACPEVIGSTVALPADFTTISAAIAGNTAGTIIAPVAPTTGGIYTGSKALLLSMVVVTAPTNNGLSQIKGSITIQANIETFNALVRGPECPVIAVQPV